MVPILKRFVRNNNKQLVVFNPKLFFIHKMKYHILLICDLWLINWVKKLFSLTILIYLKMISSCTFINKYSGMIWNAVLLQLGLSHLIKYSQTNWTFHQTTAFSNEIPLLSHRVIVNHTTSLPMFQANHGVWHLDNQTWDLKGDRESTVCFNHNLAVS
jgi:hypothetical protein